VNNKQFVVGILLAMILLTLTSIPMAHQLGGTYDPWLDYNDDGKIDVGDLYPLGQAYGTSGEPMNKTALLLDLLSRVEALENEVVELNNTIGLGAPDYDSGVISVSLGQFNYVNHNLGTTRLMVYLVGVDNDGHYHQIQYGGAIIDSGWTKRGAWWKCVDDNTIGIWSESHMDNVYPWSHVRVMIWIIPQP
jgi:hypothetical protein